MPFSPFLRGIYRLRTQARLDILYWMSLRFLQIYTYIRTCNIWPNKLPPCYERFLEIWNLLIKVRNFPFYETRSFITVFIKCIEIHYGSAESIQYLYNLFLQDTSLIILPPLHGSPRRLFSWDFQAEALHLSLRHVLHYQTSTFI